MDNIKFSNPVYKEISSEIKSAKVNGKQVTEVNSVIPKVALNYKVEETTTAAMFSNLDIGDMLEKLAKISLRNQKRNHG